MERLKMKKILLMISCLLLSWNASALDLAGIHLVDRMQVGDTVLQLNGGGIRTKFFFKIYVGALYLPEKQTSAEAIIADNRAHRVVLYILHELSSEKLYNSVHEAIEGNHTPAEMSALGAQLNQLKDIFDSVHEVKPNDIVMLDYLPASGTRVTVNGSERGTIAGAGFSRALLRIWLGRNPVQDDLKKGMLGG
jgi:hypothetical protein